MSRFDNLEFEDARRAAGRRVASGMGTGAPLRDAAYFQQQADEDFRWGRLETALRNYSRALEQDGAVVECWLMQVRILTELEEHKEASIWADKALEMFPENPELLAAKAIAAVRMNLTDKAMAYSDNAVARQGATPFAWLARGEVLLARRSGMASHCFDRALSGCREPELRAWMRLEMARVLRRYGRYSEGLYQASAAAKVIPQYPSAWLELGLCQDALGLPEAALSFEEALGLDSGCGEARRALTRHQYRGFWGGIRRLFRRLARK